VARTVIQPRHPHRSESVLAPGGNCCDRGRIRLLLPGMRPGSKPASAPSGSSRNPFEATFSASVAGPPCQIHVKP